MSTQPMKAAIYARKSTAQDGFAEDSKSVTRQVEGAVAFVKKRGWTIDDDHVYADDGISGALFVQRPEFQRMMRDAKARAFTAVVFYDLDRFGRHAHQTMVALNALADVGVSVWDFSTGIEVDLESFEGRITTSLKAEFAQQYRDQIRKHTTRAMRVKAQQGHVTGGRVFGYDNRRIAKGETARVINRAEADVVLDIYTRFAQGQGARTIAANLNREGALSPRSQLGRPNGWSASTVRAVLERPLYRGLMVYGRTAKAFDRELRKAFPDTKREKGQIPKPEDTWTKVEKPELRIIDAVLADRVDNRRQDRRSRYIASINKATGRMPEKAHGKYLLSGGMLVCPTCHGHFEALKSPWKSDGGVYVCATRRRKPGVCSNTLALPMADADETILSMIEGEVLGAKLIEEMIALVDCSEEHEHERLQMDLDRVKGEMDRLIGSIAAGVPAESVAPAIKERTAAIARLQSALAAPRAERPTVDRLRAALAQRTAEWKADLRREPTIARLVLRRVIGPLELRGGNTKEFVEWASAVMPELLTGLVAPYSWMASPKAADPFSFAGLLGNLRPRRRQTGRGQHRPVCALVYRGQISFIKRMLADITSSRGCSRQEFVSHSWIDGASGIFCISLIKSALVFLGICIVAPIKKPCVHAVIT